MPRKRQPEAKSIKLQWTWLTSIYAPNGYIIDMTIYSEEHCMGAILYEQQFTDYENAKRICVTSWPLVKIYLKNNHPPKEGQ